MKSRQVCVLHCAKAFGERYDCECACFVNATGLDAVRELESSGRRFIWFIVSTSIYGDDEECEPRGS